MLDTVTKFETPEGVDLELHVAGPVVRACAWAIDALIRIAIYWMAGTTLVVFGNVAWGLLAIGFFLMEWFYPVLFEVYQGATPGKRLMNISVVEDDGTPVSMRSSMIRNLLWIADFFPSFYFTGLIAMTLNGKFKRLGDLAAGTLVVYTQRDSQRELSIPDHDPLALPKPLTAEEKSAILSFAERSEQLTQDRQIEISNIVKIYSGASEEVGRSRIMGYANWLVKGSES